jgi:hypothetical protein
MRATSTYHRAGKSDRQNARWVGKSRTTQCPAPIARPAGESDHPKG